MQGSDFTKFRRQLLWDAVVEVCKDIRMVNGYNTQPFVTNDPRLSQSSDEAFTLLIGQGIESIADVGIGGCMTVDLTIDIFGYSASKDSNPGVMLNQLIQDVRNAMSKNLGLISDLAGGGIALSYGDLDTDQGALAIDGMAAFLLPVSFTYKSGSTTGGW